MKKKALFWAITMSILSISWIFHCVDEVTVYRVVMLIATAIMGVWWWVRYFNEK